MRRIFIILIGLLTGISMLAKESNSSKKTVYTEAATLTLVGKIHDNTPIIVLTLPSSRDSLIRKMLRFDSLQE